MSILLNNRDVLEDDIAHVAVEGNF